MMFRRAGKHHGTAIAAVALIVASAQYVGAAGPPVNVTVESCTTCHGPAGVSNGGMPTIAGQTATELAEALHGFRDGVRTGTIMGRLVGPLSDEDITAISAYFAAIKGTEQ